MPIYEYRCPKCGLDFELLRRMSETSETARCPQCGVVAERQVSVFASKVGFYVRAPAKPAFRKPSKEGDTPPGEAKNSG
jgi:putative FmdB family regulatory protein